MPENFKKIVLDLETQNTFSEVGWGNTSRMRVSVAGIYSYEQDAFMIFQEENILELLPIMEAANLVIGFNIRKFDYAVLEPYFNKALTHTPTLDIMEEVIRSLGHRLKLQDLVTATLGEGKLGHGLDAIRYFREGEMDKLVTYCKNDVRLTRDLYEYGKKHGQVLYQSKGTLKNGVISVQW